MQQQQNMKYVKYGVRTVLDATLFLSGKRRALSGRSFFYEIHILKPTVITEWPEDKEQVPLPIRVYWRYRDEITVHNGVLFRSHMVLIPKLLQEEILGKIHSSHLGIESCLRKLETVCSGPA